MVFSLLFYVFLVGSVKIEGGGGWVGGWRSGGSPVLLSMKNSAVSSKSKIVAINKKSSAKILTQV